MRPRSLAAAAVLALAVALPSLPASASAAAELTCPTTQTTAAKAHAKATKAATGKAKAKKAKAKAKKAAKAKKVHAKFNLGGRLVGVEGNTVTYLVHGGKEKGMRGQCLTVVLAEGARILRNDAPATLADFENGDKIRAKGVKAAGVYTAKRVKAVDPDWDDDAPLTPEPEAPEPEAPAPDA